MVLDLEAGSLAFKVDNTYLGPAFSGLKGPLYPVISTVWGNSEVSLVYRWDDILTDCVILVLFGELLKKVKISRSDSKKQG